MRKPSLAELEAAADSDVSLPPLPTRPAAPQAVATPAPAAPKPAVAPPPVIEATAVPPSVPAHVEDAPDELPAVGKVAAEGATRSMWQAFKKAGAPGKSSGAAPVSGPPEPPHLASIKAQALTRVPGNRAAMFDAARFVAWDDATGQASLWFPYDAISAMNYVKKHRNEFETAFGDQLGQAVTFAFDIESEPTVTTTAHEEENKPRVVRPNLDEVAAEDPGEMLRPTVDVDAVKDDPIVAALLKAFDGARIVKVE